MFLRKRVIGTESKSEKESELCDLGVRMPMYGSFGLAIKPSELHAYSRHETRHTVASIYPPKAMQSHHLYGTMRYFTNVSRRYTVIVASKQPCAGHAAVLRPIHSTRNKGCGARHW
jgi:hypothetical protein